MAIKPTPTPETPPKTPRKPRTKAAVVEPEVQYYIRNRGYVRVRIAPPRKKGDEYSYDLAPRGERGDAEPIDDLDYNYLSQHNADRGLYDLLTEEEARAYMYKQTTNQQHYHPALAALQDEFGNPIRGISHESTPQPTFLTQDQVVVPEGDLNQLNQMPPGRPE